MSRVMLVCPEPLGHGQPAGVGIRFLEIARILRRDGHAIVVHSPDAGAVEGCRSAGTDLPSLLAGSESNDVAVVQGHVANDFFDAARPIPVVVDLYDPFIIENLHYHRERGQEVFRHDHATLASSIARGDFFLCASEAQRFFYLGLLLAAGRVNPLLFESDPRFETLLALAPFGVGPARDVVARTERAPDILFGGIYDWYDPVAAIETVAIVRESIPAATLTFTRHPNPGITPQGELAAAMAHVRKKGYDFVSFVPWTPYEQRAEFFERFALALLTFPRSIETDLSMRTRVYDYLWCGLPVVTSPSPGIDGLLSRYGCGSVLPVASPAAFAAEIVALLGNGDRYDAMLQGTRRFVRDHQWEETLAPLREFCLHPLLDETRQAFTAGMELRDRPDSLIDRIRRRLRA